MQLYEIIKVISCSFFHIRGQGGTTVANIVCDDGINDWALSPRRYQMVDGTWVIKRDGTNYYYDNPTTGTQNTKDGDDVEITAEEAQFIERAASAAGTTVENHSLNDLINSIRGISDGITGEGEARLTEITNRLTEIQALLASASSRIGSGNASPEETARLAQLIQTLTQEAGQLLAEGQRLSPGNEQLSQLATQMRPFGVTIPSESAEGAAPRAATTPGAGAGADEGEGGGNPRGATDGARGAGVTWDFGGSTLGSGGPKFDMDAYLSSVYADQAIFDGWDQIGKNKMQQQRIMMVYAKLASMSMSGDLTAMYRFMQFITSIISRDKALQNIHLAGKMIEYENQSREYLNELMETPAPDGKDQAQSYEFTKTLERTRANQSSIATAQKMLAQSMEEMGQVSETLFGVLASILQSNKRVGQIISA